VKLGLEEVAADLFRVKPYVYSAPDSSAVVVFSGYLTNLPELSRRSALSGGSGSGSARASPSASADANNGHTLERKSSIERSMDLGAATARLVLALYQAGQADGNEVIMLSELQVRHRQRECAARRLPRWCSTRALAHARTHARARTHAAPTRLLTAACVWCAVACARTHRPAPGRVCAGDL
jgi:hypothetical protein